MPYSSQLLRDIANPISPKIPTPIERRQTLAALQNTVGAGQLQQQQIAAGQDVAAQRQQAMQKQAQIAAILQQPGAIDEKGSLTDETLVAVSKLDPTHGAALMKAFGKDPDTLSQNQRRSDETRIAEAGQAETVKNNEASSLRDYMKIQDARNRPTEVSAGATLVPSTQQLPYTAPVKPTTDNSTTPFEAWQKQNPGRPIGEWLALEAKNKPPSNAGSGAMASDPKDIAQAIIDGKQPPVLTSLYREAAPVRAELARRGYNMATALTDWTATQKYLATLNGTQQTRLRQAISFTAETLPQVEAAYAEWKKQAGISGVKLLNKANLAAMKQLPGAPGSAAQQLDSLIADFTSELGTVYKGGNSSTDESLKLAAKNLEGDWNEKTFGDAVKRLNQSLTIRKNSMTAGPAGGVGSEYAPQAAPAAVRRYNQATGKIE